MPLRRPGSPAAPVQNCTGSLPSLGSCVTGRRGRDVLGGAVRTGSPCLPCRGAEPARGGAALWHSPQYRTQDADAGDAEHEFEAGLEIIVTLEGDKQAAQLGLTAPLQPGDLAARQAAQARRAQL